MESQYGSSSDKNTSESNGEKSINTCKDIEMNNIGGKLIKGSKNKSIHTEEVKNENSSIENGL